MFLYPNDFFSEDCIGDTGYEAFTTFDDKGIPLYFNFNNLKVKKNRSVSNQLWNDLLKFRIVKYFNVLYRKNKLQKQFSAYEIETLLKMPISEFENICFKNKETYPLITCQWDLIALMRNDALLDHKTNNRIEYTLSVIANMHQYLNERSIEFGVVYIPWDM